MHVHDRYLRCYQLKWTTEGASNSHLPGATHFLPRVDVIIKGQFFSLIPYGNVLCLFTYDYAFGKELMTILMTMTPNTHSIPNKSCQGMLCWYITNKLYKHKTGIPLYTLKAGNSNNLEKNQQKAVN